MTLVVHTMIDHVSASRHAAEAALEHAHDEMPASSLVDRLSGANKSLRDLGVKQAPFVVLIGASMPSALAEISFLSNSQDVRLIRGPAYRQRIADALFEAIRQYQVSLKNETKDAQE